MSRTVLICLNSHQVVQNVIAVQNVQPQRVIVLTTSETAGQLTWLRSAVVRQGIRFTADDIVTLHPTDFADLERSLNRLKDILQRQEQGSRIVLNATGGTKPMSLMAHAVLKSLDAYEAMYIDTQSQESLIRFHPEPVQPRRIEQHPDIRTTFAAYGFTLQQRGTRATSNEMDAVWSRTASDFDLARKVFSGLPFLNRRKSSESFSAKAKIPLHADVRAFLDLLASAGLFSSHRTVHGAIHIDFCSGAPSKSYCDLVHMHGWLEEFLLWLLVRKIGVDEAIRNVEVLHPESPEIFAEFDVVVRSGTRVLMFECKCGGKNLALKDAIPNLATKAHQVAGTFGQPVLLLADLNHSRSRIHQARADAAGVRLIGPKQMADLENRLRAIVTDHHPAAG